MRISAVYARHLATLQRRRDTYAPTSRPLSLSSSGCPALVHEDWRRPAARARSASSINAALTFPTQHSVRSMASAVSLSKASSASTSWLEHVAFLAADGTLMCTGSVRGARCHLQQNDITKSARKTSKPGYVMLQHNLAGLINPVYAMLDDHYVDDRPDHPREPDFSVLTSCS